VRSALREPITAMTGREDLVDIVFKVFRERGVRCGEVVAGASNWNRDGHSWTADFGSWNEGLLLVDLGC
jgi:hypothetical protein